jgi:hypothetical protein
VLDEIRLRSSAGQRLSKQFWPCSIVGVDDVTLDGVVQAKLWPTMKANWVVWPLANFIAFRFLHQDMRILYANFIGVSTL